MPQSLPVELPLLVLEEAIGSSPSVEFLAAAALVCRSWRFIAQREMFHTIGMCYEKFHCNRAGRPFVFLNKFDFEKFGKDKKSRVRAHVRCMEICHVEVRDQQSCLSKVTSTDIQPDRIRIDYADGVVHVSDMNLLVWPSRLSGITALDICHARSNLYSSHFVVEALNVLPSLRHFKLCNTSGRDFSKADYFKTYRFPDPVLVKGHRPCNFTFFDWNRCLVPSPSKNDVLDCLATNLDVVMAVGVLVDIGPHRVYSPRVPTELKAVVGDVAFRISRDERTSRELHLSSKKKKTLTKGSAPPQYTRGDRREYLRMAECSETED